MPPSFRAPPFQLPDREQLAGRKSLWTRDRKDQAYISFRQTALGFGHDRS